MSREIELKVRNILSKVADNQIKINTIGLEDSLIEIGINSTGFIKLVVEIESEFGIDFDDEDLNLNCFKNLKELINYVERRH